MSRELLRQVFNKQTVARIVSNALRLAHQNDGSSIKEISKITGIDAFTISNWYQANNTPSSAHLLMLMTFYPDLLENVLGSINSARHQLSLPSEIIGITMPDNNLNICVRTNYFRDNNVPENALTYIKPNLALNKRQLWFLRKLQENGRPNARTIARQWQVNQRTAKRDIASLIENNIVRFCGARKNGYYLIISKP